MEWIKDCFATKGHLRALEWHGYVGYYSTPPRCTPAADNPAAFERFCESRAAFGIAKVRRGEWLIFHLPSGYTFLYSRWPTLAEAKRYAEALLNWRGEELNHAKAWDDSDLGEHPDRFNMACHEIADTLGFPRRQMTSIS
jgi:hypothetical protein